MRRPGTPGRIRLIGPPSRGRPWRRRVRAPRTILSDTASGCLPENNSSIETCHTAAPSSTAWPPKESTCRSPSGIRRTRRSRAGGRPPVARGRTCAARAFSRSPRLSMCSDAKPRSSGAGPRRSGTVRRTFGGAVHGSNSRPARSGPGTSRLMAGTRSIPPAGVVPARTLRSARETAGAIVATDATMRFDVRRGCSTVAGRPTSCPGRERRHLQSPSTARCRAHTLTCT